MARCSSLDKKKGACIEDAINKALAEFTKIAVKFAAGQAQEDDLYVLRDSIIKEHLGSKRTSTPKAVA